MRFSGVKVCIHTKINGNSRWSHFIPSTTIVDTLVKIGIWLRVQKIILGLPVDSKSVFANNEVSVVSV